MATRRIKKNSRWNYLLCKTVYNKKNAYNKYNYTSKNLQNVKKHTAEHILNSVSEEYYQKHIESDMHVEKTIGKDIKNDG